MVSSKSGIFRHCVFAMDRRAGLRRVAGMKMKLTKNDAQEVLHKLAILADCEELQADYKITQVQADALRDSIPRNGGEWAVPSAMVEAVKGEMQDHAHILRHIASDARAGNEVGQALGIDKQAKRLEAAFV